MRFGSGHLQLKNKRVHMYLTGFDSEISSNLVVCY